MAVHDAALFDGLDQLRDDGADVDAPQLDLQVPCIEPRDVQKLVDDLRQALGLRCDVAEEDAPVLVAERNVLSKQCLGESVNRRQRRAQLVRDGGHEVGLDFLDHAIGGDVPEREDASRYAPERIAHHGLAQ